jgi:F0F1-type ATP synthase membrane subunit b/b'
MDPRRSLVPTVVLPIAAALVLVAAPAGAAEEGLSIFPDPLQLLVLIVSFAVLVVPVNALLVRPLLGTLAERGTRIEGARERAAELAREADASLARHRSALEAARAEAERERRGAVEAARGEQARLTAEARAASEREIERAREEIRDSLADARGALRRDAQVLAREAVARILGRPVS